MLNEPSNYAEFVDAVNRLLDVKEKLEAAPVAKLTYFRESGKYYAGAELPLLPNENFWDLLDRVRLLIRDSRLPGLTAGHSEYHVLVETPEGEQCHGVPHLIPFTS